MTRSPTDPLPASEAATRACAHSRFLTRLFDARPELRAQVEADLHRPVDESVIRRLLSADPPNEGTLSSRLRQLRARVFATVAARDLAGLAGLQEVTAAMTALAEVAIGEALPILSRPLLERHGEPVNAAGEPVELIVIGMGKLGGGELNVSSDIDLIFVYPEDGDTRGPSSISNFEYFTRLGRKLIETLSAVTGDGQVFRVDMRLRPNGDSGSLVGSFDMLENYFITQGREWERYAWIKARPMTGSRWKDLEAIARPFVFRKYLDFGAFNAMRELHAQIRREVARREMANHIKLGPGGIREIEFIAQVFQLIRGGRDAALQIKPTVPVLRQLARRGILGAEAVGELAAAYDFLRRLEHRLQYVEDQQTHRIPENEADRALIAGAMGFADFESMAAALDGHRARVSRHFEAIFSDPTEDGHELEAVWQGAENGGEHQAEEFERLGYRDPGAAASRLRAIRASSRYQQLAPQIRARFDALVPRIIATAAATAEPDAALGRILDLVETISRRGAYLALLQQYPQALEQVGHLVGASSWAAEYLIRHPILLDELLDTRLLETAPDWPGYRAQLSHQLDAIEPDMEGQMDVMRESHHAQVFRLLTQDLAGLLTVERLADHLSELADAMLTATIRLCWGKMRQRHREAPRFAVVSYGKLGGKELGYASDLDVIFLYDDESPEAPDAYARLAQRINTWLSSRTSAGILFETDLRLRPNGEAGLLVSSIEAFRKYQLESAWVWEHQALTRARYSAGDARVGIAFEAIRVEILCQPRDPDRLRREVLDMRHRMLEAHANRGELFDLKHDPGGLIDVEFIVQYLVLGHSHRHSRLTANLGNNALLAMAGELGLIPQELAEKARLAYREYRRLQHRLRLNGARYARVDREAVRTHVEAVLELWRVVFGEDNRGA